MSLRIVLAFCLVCLSTWPSTSHAQSKSILKERLTPPTRDELMLRLGQATAKCDDRLDNHDKEIAQILKRLSDLSTDNADILSTDAFRRLVNHMISESAEEVNAENGKVCPDALVRAFARRLENLKNALASPQGASTLPRVIAKKPVVKTQQFPIDAFSSDRRAICENARLIERCKDVLVGNETLHGDLYLSCDGERMLILHRKR